jgi:hypothetical protein
VGLPIYELSLVWVFFRAHIYYCQYQCEDDQRHADYHHIDSDCLDCIHYIPFIGVLTIGYVISTKGRKNRKLCRLHYLSITSCGLVQ